MELTIFVPTRQKRNGVMVKLDRAEALSLIESLVRQMRTNACNAGRVEFSNSHGDYASVAVLPEPTAQKDPYEREPLLDVEYKCPGCEHDWNEQWTSACDSQCPNCGMKNITALDWGPAKLETKT